jgi:NADH:ubiquinone oxidoreductase subunit 3 (subunit A)
VDWTQIVFGVVLVLVLLFTSIFYTVRQILALRRMRNAEEMPLEDHAYLRTRALRRLVMSFLLFVLGILLAGGLIFLEPPAQRLADSLESLRAQGQIPPMDAEQREVARAFLIFWIIFLLILMAVVLLAAWDYWSTRRYALTQYRKIRNDRRAMIEREIARARHQRNGHH